jgi:hypothetical protein
MRYTKILRYRPWLKPVHQKNICNRLLRATRGDMFLAYNTYNGQYELHSVKTFQLIGDSYNVSLPKEFLNGFIINDFKANNHKRFKVELESERQKISHMYELNEQSQVRMDSLFKILERVYGAKL